MLLSLPKDFCDFRNYLHTKLRFSLATSLKYWNDVKIHLRDFGSKFTMRQNFFRAKILPGISVEFVLGVWVILWWFGPRVACLVAKETDKLWQPYDFGRIYFDFHQSGDLKAYLKKVYFERICSSWNRHNNDSHWSVCQH